MSMQSRDGREPARADASRLALSKWMNERCPEWTTLLTDHEVTYWNQNVLLCPVWAMAFVVLARDLARATPRRPGLMMRLVGAAAACALLALLLRVLPNSQHTGPALSFFVPQWLGAGVAVWMRIGRPLPRGLPSRRQGAVPSIPPRRTPPL